MKYLHGQILTHSLLAIYWGAMAVSGAASRRKISIGPITAKVRDCTPEENTDSAMATMLRQIHFVRECCESLPTGDDK